MVSWRRADVVILTEAGRWNREGPQRLRPARLGDNPQGGCGAGCSQCSGPGAGRTAEPEGPPQRERRTRCSDLNLRTARFSAGSPGAL